jgi:hypothetical protein
MNGARLAALRFHLVTAVAVNTKRENLESTG